MASFIRPSSVLRQSLLSMSKTPATRTAFYSTKSPLAATFVRPSQIQKKESPVSSQIAAFHATGKKEILPPLPRECSTFSIVIAMGITTAHMAIDEAYVEC